VGPTTTNSYLIQVSAKGSDGPPMGWAEYREALETMALQLVVLWVALCFGGGGALMLNARWVGL
jgi:hypothetical protein